jgi:uncharacterized protein YbjQ (UPF0145 family)
MKLLTIDYVPGREIEDLGLVQAGMVQSKNIGKDIAASFKTLVGGELFGYTEMMNESRAMATKRIVEQAEKMGADAIIGIRYVSAAIVQGAAEVVAYGTAVKIKQ